MKRRSLLKMFGVAPAIILTPNLLMPVKSLYISDQRIMQVYESNLSKLFTEGIRNIDAIKWRGLIEDTTLSDRIIMPRLEIT